MVRGKCKPDPDHEDVHGILKTVGRGNTIKTDLYGYIFIKIDLITFTLKPFGERPANKDVLVGPPVVPFGNTPVLPVKDRPKFFEGLFIKNEHMSKKGAPSTASYPVPLKPTRDRVRGLY